MIHGTGMERRLEEGPFWHHNSQPRDSIKA